MRIRQWRQLHRYLGLVIGIQLFLWTLSGLIFSWNSIESVRGENLIREQAATDLKNFELKNLKQIMHEHASRETVSSAMLRSMLDRPVYELTIDRDGTSNFILVDAVTGERLSPISEETAGRIAQEDFAPSANIRTVDKIESVGSHSEYRAKELPAFCVVMEHPTGTAIYVSANRGVVTTRRNNQWRMFDFFWMLHTMDYQGRDNFNHWVLKALSVLGLTTVVSGFVLWIKTSKTLRRKTTLKRKSGGDTFAG